MQKLSVQLHIPIPDNMVLIEKIEYEQLLETQLTGVYWSMKDLEDHTNKKSVWIKENILYPSHFRKILDIENGGFVFYPKAQGQNWAFQASKMAEFLEKRFAAIFNH